MLSGRTLVPDLPLFRSEADRALRIFKRLRIPDLIGQPTMGEVAGPWLFPIVEAIFGSYDPETHQRMIQEFFWLIPKKNSKTSSAAAIMMQALIMNYRPEAEYVLVAPTLEIAGISYRQAKGTIKADPELAKIFHAQDHKKTITHRLTGATLQVKAADTDVITGGKQVGTMIDEIHVLASRPNAADILLELRGALATRPDGFLIFVTTQSKKPPVGVFKSELAKARDVRDGIRRLPLLPILYELPPEICKDGGWKNEKYWPLVSPNLGRSLSLEFLRTNLETAEKEGPAALALFASQHHNVEIGMALRTDAWAGAAYWLKQADPTLTLDAILAQCEVVCIGIDGGGLDDLLGFSVVGRVTADAEEGHVAKRKWLSWNKTWCHRKVFELRKSEAPQLEDFVKAGELIVVDEMTDAFTQLAAVAEVVNDSGLLHQVGLDPAGVGLIVDALAEVEIAGDDVVVAVTQGWKMTGAVKTTEVKLAAGQLSHPGQGIMTWAVGNAKVEPRGNAIIITKQAAGTAKIDPLMALFDAVALMSLNPESKQSYLDTEDLLVL